MHTSGRAPNASHSHASTGGPLSGVLLADFSRVLAAPYATMLLADLGATVIKVEGPGGDDTRSFRPPTRNGEATYYLSSNRNKRSIVLDFNNASDLELAQELAKRSDIVVENFRPGSLSKFQLDYSAISNTNPGVIYGSLTGFGPNANQPGYDVLAQALSGFMSVTGDPDGPPVRAGIPIFDVISGLHLTIGILAALEHRNKTGEGQRVDANLLSSALSGMANQSAAYVSGGVIPGRTGNDHPSLFPYGPMPTKEGKLVIACGNDRQFQVLATVLDREEWLVDDRFSQTYLRTINREELRPLLNEALSQKTAQEWYRLLSDGGCPCAPINSLEQGFQLAEELGLNPIVPVGSGERVIPTVRNPIAFSRTPATYDLAPPTLGQDSEALRSWLAKPNGD